MQSINDVYNAGNGAILASIETRYLRDGDYDPSNVYHNCGRISVITGYNDDGNPIYKDRGDSTTNKYTTPTDGESKKPSVNTVVIDNDAMSRPPTVSIARLTSSTVEGREAKFRVSRSGSTAYELGVSLWIDETGDMFGSFCRSNQYTIEHVLSRVTFYILPGQRKCRVGIFIPSGKRYLDVAVPTYTDNVVEETNTITAVVSDERRLYYYASTSRHTASIQVRDNNAGLINISMEKITETDTVVEGQPIQYKIVREEGTEVLAAVEVKMRITAPEGVLGLHEQIISLPYNVDEVTVIIPTVNQELPTEGAQTVTVILLDDEGDAPGENTTPTLNLYEISGGVRSFSVGVTTDSHYLTRYSADRKREFSVNEGAPFILKFRMVGDTEGNEYRQVDYHTEDGTAMGTVQLSYDTDYYSAGGRLEFKSSAREQQIRVNTVSESIDDAGETFTVHISTPDIEGRKIYFKNYGSDAATNPFLESLIVTVTLTNDGVLPKAWVAEFAHSSATGAVDNIKDRLDSWRDDGVWTKITRSRIDGSDITGTNLGVIVGYDQSHGPVTIGTALVVNEADGSMEDYDLEGSVSTAYAYTKYLPQERLGLWGAVGYGVGQIGLVTKVFDENTGLNMQIQAAGFDLRLIATEKMDLDLSTGAIWVAAESANAKQYRGAEAASHRYTTGLALDYRLTDQISALAEYGYEKVGGDVEYSEAETGSVGLAYTDSQFRVEASIVVFDDFAPEVSLAFREEDWQASLALTRTDYLEITGSFDFDIGQDKRGLVVNFRPEYSAEPTMNVRVGYGFLHGRRVIRPYLDLSAQNEQEYGVEYELDPLVLTLAVTDRPDETYYGLKLVGKW